MKAIYGLATSYKYPVVEYELLTNSYKVTKLSPGSIVIDSLVGATIEHDYSKEIGRTSKNLSLVLNERGLYFRLIPDNPLAFETYKKVKRGLLSQCSCSFIYDRKRDYNAEKKLYTVNSLIKGKETFKVYDPASALIYEICLCEYPKNEETFATTNKHDPRLMGLKWEDEGI